MQWGHGLFNIEGGCGFVGHSIFLVGGIEVEGGHKYQGAINNCTIVHGRLKPGTTTVAMYT